MECPIFNDDDIKTPKLHSCTHILNESEMIQINNYYRLKMSDFRCFFSHKHGLVCLEHSEQKK
ncbi:hypothetical protein DERF_004392 [Dermatophagoides farinae]|uniref:Uncharacterized protein n=1 Tax=Dermatophagoides farinae TaxID=6954 RepID=A0A922I1V0_DERFA|nr:hypothetical protein DERF_004392 [Dermatophagoides farinae]